MLQRLQSLLLLFAALLILGVFFFPLAQVSKESQNYELIYRGMVDIQSKQPVSGNTSYILAALLTLIFGLTFFTIFLYKNRRLQMKMCLLSSFLIILASFLIVYHSFYSVSGAASNFGISAFFPIASFLLVLAARMRIKKDDDLVKSVDRIR